jgi:D-tyrosyl-tRNA(Tyr) deacylase
MKRSFIFSSSDQASENLCRAVREVCEGEFIQSSELLSSDAADKASGEILLFLSRHESAQKLPALLVHAPGNWGKALHGGLDRKLCRTDAKFIRSLVLSLRRSRLICPATR